MANLIYHARMRSLILLALGLLLLAGCAQENSELRVLPLTYQALDSERMEAIFVERSNLQMAPADPRPGVSALEALVANQADLTLIENSTPFTAGIRAVLPAYKSVMHLLVREGATVESAAGLLGTAAIHVANDSLAGKTFIRTAARRQGVDEDNIRFVDQVDEDTQLIVYFGPIAPDITPWYRPGFRLVSMGDTDQDSGQHLKGFSYILPQMQPAVIPQRTYDLPGNELPIATLQVDMLLVTRKQVPETQVYELTRTLIEQKQRFMAIAPAVFSGLNEAFDPLSLNFPLHAGARRFLERDEPSLLERYAETINMLVYISVLLLTGLVAAARWRARRKKDRADVFYARVLAIRERAGDGAQAGLLSELDSLEREAFQMLIDEKLSADESFRIFTDLLERTRADLRQ